MQKTIIDTLALFAFDCESLKQQWQVERAALLEYLQQKYLPEQAAAKYAAICRNVAACIKQQYNITL